MLEVKYYCHTAIGYAIILMLTVLGILKGVVSI